MARVGARLGSAAVNTGEADCENSATFVLVLLDVSCEQQQGRSSSIGIQKTKFQFHSFKRNSKFWAVFVNAPFLISHDMMQGQMGRRL